MILAFYRYNAPGATPLDWWINSLTGFGGYSHVEIGFCDGHWLPDWNRHCYTDVECFSSSPRDGGTRFKRIDLSDRETWDIVPVTPQGRTESAVREFCRQQDQKPYFWLGVVGFVVPPLRDIHELRRRWFCSEICETALGWTRPFYAMRTHPNKLHRIALRRLNQRAAIGHTAIARHGL